MTSSSGQNGRRPPGSFVGRERELAELLSALEETPTRSHVFLISGEPGIGKTRLADELATEARDRGLRVVWGRCWEGGGTPAYWPFIQIVRACLESIESDRLSSTPNPEITAQVATEVAKIVPELRPAHGDEPPASKSVDMETSRFRLFDAVATFLKTLARRTPILIVMDDLHDADLSSLELLKFAARGLGESHIMIVGTYRDAEVRRSPDLEHAIGEILRHGNQMPLSGLEEGEVAQMIEHRANRAPTAVFASEMHRITAGNPLFVDGVVRVLVAERKIGTDDSVDLRGFHLPEGVRGAIRKRLAMLSDKAQLALRAAAVIGQEFEAGLLEQLDHLNSETLEQVIEETSQVGIVTAVSPETHRFTHPLIRKTLYDQTTSAERAILHRAIGETLEQAHAANLGPHLATLAYHFREAGNAEKAIDYSILAGKAAFKAFAFEQAFSHLQTGLELIDRHGGSPETRAEVLHMLSDETVSGRRCIEFLEAAVKADEAIGNKESWACKQAELGLRLSSPNYAGQDVARGLQHLRAAEPILNEGPLRNHQCKFFLQLAPALTWALEVEAGLQAVTRAMEIAEHLEGGERDFALSVAASELGLLLIIKGQLAEGFGLLQRGWEIADRINDTAAASTAAWSACVEYSEIWDPVEAEKWCTRELATTRTSQSPERRRILMTNLVNSKALRGKLDEALEVHKTRKGEGSFTQAKSSRLINFFKGEWSEADNQITRLVQRFPDRGDLDSESRALFWGARVKRTMNDLVSAYELADRCISICFERSKVLGEMQMQPEAALLSTEMNRLDEGKCHLDRCREIMAQGEDWRGLAGHVARADAVLAAANGGFAESEQEFEKAVAIFRRYQVPFEEAEAFWFWGRALKGRSDSRSNEKFDAAIEIYRRHGAGQRWIDRVESARSASRPSPIEREPKGGAGVGESAPGPAIFKREGEFWTLAYRGSTYHLRDVKGLGYIAFLLAHPGDRIHVHELISRVDGVPASGSQTSGTVPRETPTTDELGDAGSVLDRRAQSDYRRRLQDLAEELAEAQRHNDIGRVERVRNEQEFLTGELSAAFGIGGRDRKIAAQVERVRSMVSKRIRASMEKIRSEDAILGRYLAASIKTGYYCAYLPDPERQISWQF